MSQQSGIGNLKYFEKLNKKLEKLSNKFKDASPVKAENYNIPFIRLTKEEIKILNDEFKRVGLNIFVKPINQISNNIQNDIENFTIIEQSFKGNKENNKQNKNTKIYNTNNFIGKKRILKKYSDLENKSYSFPSANSTQITIHDRFTKSEFNPLTKLSFIDSIP